MIQAKIALMVYGLERGEHTIIQQFNPSLDDWMAMICLVRLSEESIREYKKPLVKTLLLVRSGRYKRRGKRWSGYSLESAKTRAVIFSTNITIIGRICRI